MLWSLWWPQKDGAAPPSLTKAPWSPHGHHKRHRHTHPQQGHHSWGAESFNQVPEDSQFPSEVKFDKESIEKGANSPLRSMKAKQADSSTEHAEVPLSAVTLRVLGMWGTNTPLAAAHGYPEPCEVHSLLPLPFRGDCSPLCLTGNLERDLGSLLPGHRLLLRATAGACWRCQGFARCPGWDSHQTAFPASQPAPTSRVPSRVPVQGHRSTLSPHQFECIPEQISWHPLPTPLSSTALPLQPGDKTRSLGSQGGKWQSNSIWVFLSFLFFPFFFFF